MPLGWQISVPVHPVPLRIAYGYKEAALPIGLRLTEFEVDRNEGVDTPAGFKSTVEITNADGEKTTGQCWMNNPISYPDSWVNTFSGFTYKISQASWNPENLNQSTVQILRDPGWSLKWMGSLCIVAGVFFSFICARIRRICDALRKSRARGKTVKAGNPRECPLKYERYCSMTPRFLAAVFVAILSIQFASAAAESPIDFRQWSLLAIQDGGRTANRSTRSRRRR